MPDSNSSFEKIMSDLWTTRSYLQRILEDDRQFMARAKSFLATAAQLPPIASCNIYLPGGNDEDTLK